MNNSQTDKATAQLKHEIERLISGIKSAERMVVEKQKQILELKYPKLKSDQD